MHSSVDQLFNIAMPDPTIMKNSSFTFIILTTISVCRQGFRNSNINC